MNGKVLLAVLTILVGSEGCTAGMDQSVSSPFRFATTAQAVELPGF